MYDIPDDNIRSKVAITLKNFGLTRVQYSIFCGLLNHQQERDITEQLKLEIDKESSIYIIKGTKKCFSNIKVLGRGFNEEYVANKEDARVI